MANLGTLDRMQGLQGIANGITQNAIRNGSWGDKLAALIGGYVGDRMGQHKYKKEQQKLDDIVNAAKSTDVLDTNSIISTTPMSQEEYDYLVNGTPNTTVNQQLLQNSVGAVTPTTQKVGFNPNYNMDYIEQEARRQGIHSRAWDERKDALQRDVARNAEAFYLPQIQQKLYGDDATTDSIIEGMGMLSELSKYSPDAAKAYQALAVGGLQGNQKFEQQKQLKQMDNDARIAAATVKANSKQKGIDTNVKNIGYYDKEIDAVMKEMAAIEKDTAAAVQSAKEEGRAFDPSGSTNDRRYTELSSRLKRLQQARESLLGGNQNVGSTDDTVVKKPAKPQNPINQFFDGVNYDDYNQMLADGVTPDESGKVHPKGAFFKLRDYLQAAKKPDGTAYSNKEINGILMDVAKNLPTWGEGNAYYEELASRLGVETDAAKRRAEIDKAIKEQERKLELDKVLHPEKYGIDSMAGVKYFGNAIANGKPLINLAGNYK